ncbi:DUF1465 family protein [Sphingopyxis sp. PET50]|uniref:DUF1465 family protein n=1 Tax=Sphingopyxis sp. PET50 TaxID=2976533 RepID=UPI0021AFF807|nr:DUF1465 family protein [Sphingopyxis sp. PET50]
MRRSAKPVQRAQVENLYVEAMVLADEAHTAFAAARDLGAVGSAGSRDGLLQIGLACESLKTTTRLMHIIAWLLHRRAMIAGDPGAGPDDSAARIGEPVAADWTLCAQFDLVGPPDRRRERAAVRAHRGAGSGLGGGDRPSAGAGDAGADRGAAVM